MRVRKTWCASQRPRLTIARERVGPSLYGRTVVTCVGRLSVTFVSRVGQSITFVFPFSWLNIEHPTPVWS